MQGKSRAFCVALSRPPSPGCRQNSTIAILAETAWPTWNKCNKSNGKRAANDPENVITVPNNHPAILDLGTFQAVQAILDSRNPKQLHPRTAGSKQLLSGLLYCGLCGSSVSGYPAKSSQYFYYTCNKKRKYGTETCDLRSIDKNKFDQYLIERIHDEILTDENIEYLLRITNEEIGNETALSTEKLATIEKQLRETKKKLDNLIDAVERGDHQVAELSDRIHERKTQCDLLEKQKSELERKLKTGSGSIEFINRASVLHYVDNLRSLLDKGTPGERRMFLRSFIDRIEIYSDEVVVNYHVPLGTEKVEPTRTGALPLVSCGSGGRI